MRKFQNLINKRRARQNNLVNADIKRIFPLSKFSDAIYKKADDEICFKEGAEKMNPRLTPNYLGRRINHFVKSTSPQNAEEKEHTYMKIQSPKSELSDK